MEHRDVAHHHNKMNDITMAAAAERRARKGVLSATIPLHTSTRRVVRITWFSFFVVIVALLVSQDDAVEEPIPTNTGLERGKVIGEHITADQLYEAYQSIQTEYHSKAFSENQPWQILNRKEGVEVALLEDESDPTCPMVRMKAVIPASVKHCWDFLQLDQWDVNMKKMDPFYEGVELAGKYYKKGVDMILARKRMKKLLAFGKRDFVFISVEDLPLQDGTWVSGSVSVVTPKMPRVEGYTRAYQDSIAYYKPLSNDTTEVTIVCRIDLNDSAADGSGGNIPMWLYVKTIGATGARSVISMRRALAEEEEEYQLEEQLEHEHEGMRFSVPWRVPIFPHDEESIIKKRQERLERKQKEKRDEEGMRFSQPGKVPVLPHDETKEARKVRGGKNDEPKKLLLPWTRKIRSDKTKSQKQRVDNDATFSWFGRQDKESQKADERMAWPRPFHQGVFFGMSKKGSSQ